MQWSNRMGQMGRPLQKQFLHFGLSFIRQALLLSYQSAKIVTYQPKNAFSLEKFAPFVNSKNTSSLISLFEESIYAVERNANGKILFSDFCLELSRLLNMKED
jgi:DNA polymerase-3 subunit delta'